MSTNDPSGFPEDDKAIHNSETATCNRTTDFSVSEPTPKWGQDEAIAFECARECITHLMAICSGEIHEAESQTIRDELRIAALNEAQRRLANELRTLRLTNQTAIVRIRKEYGAIVKSYQIVGRLGADLSELGKV